MALENLNRQYCLVEKLPAVVQIPTIETYTPDSPDLVVYSRSDFVNTICSNKLIYVESRGEMANVGKEWTRWKGQRRARYLTYAPGKPQFFNNCLNTWMPSQIEPKKGDLSHWFRYLDHIFKSDPTHRQWFECWLAHQFQHPGVKLHSAVVFWSTQTSTGKSLFGYTMAELFGLHNFSEIGEGDLHGQFNYWAARKQFVMGEEIRGDNAKKRADFMKALITRKMVTINTKNTPHYALPDCINYFFTSNHAEAFYLDKTDRRFFVHELGSDRLSEHYVENTFKPWGRAGGYAAILHWLLHDVDLSAPLVEGKPFNPYGPPPQTKARAAMIEAGRDEEDIWIESLASSPSDTFYNTPGWKLATADDLWAKFQEDHPKSRIVRKTFVGKLKEPLTMVRGGNCVDLGPGPGKRLYCPPSSIKLYDGASTESLQESYRCGRENEDMT